MEPSAPQVPHSLNTCTFGRFQGLEHYLPLFANTFPLTHLSNPLIQSRTIGNRALVHPSWYSARGGSGTTIPVSHSLPVLHRYLPTYLTASGKVPLALYLVPRATPRSLSPPQPLDLTLP